MMIKLVEVCIGIALAVNALGLTTVVKAVSPRNEDTSRVFYVSPDGSDKNSGKSIDKAWKTPQYAADSVEPGDTVYFMSGIYGNEKWKSVMEIKTSGEDGKWITFAAYPGEKPVFKRTNDYVWNLIKIDNASYIVLDGLTVQGIADEIAYEDALKAYEHAVTAEKRDWNYLSKFNTNGISINGDYKNGSIAHHITVKNCEVFNNPGGGISGEAVDYITIEDNLVYNNAWHTMYACSGISLLHLMDCDDVANEYKAVIRNNISHTNQARVPWLNIKKLSDGNGIIIDDSNCKQIGGEPYKGKILVTNNIAYHNGGSGIHCYSSSNVDMINNVAVNNNQVLDWGELFTNQCTNVNILNNILYSDKDDKLGSSKQSADLNVTIAHNILYAGGAEKVQSFVGQNDNIADPMFVDKENFDFRVKEGSPAIDTGYDLIAPKEDYLHNPRPQGKFTDIGAYESKYTGTYEVDRKQKIVLAGDRKAAEEIITPALRGQALKGTPVIDGIMDDIWKQSQKIVLAIDTEGKSGKVHGEAYALWDEQNLYVLMDVTDPILNASSADAYQQDSVEVFIDETNSKAKKYDDGDTQFRVSYKNKKSGGTNYKDEKMVSATSITDRGYIVEMKFPLQKIKGKKGKVIGFELQINDDPGTGVRETTLKFNDRSDDSWSSAAHWGELEFVTAITKPELSTASMLTVIDDAGYGE